MNDFKIDPADPFRFLVIDRIGGGCVAMRPVVPKICALELMRPPKLLRGSDNHCPRQGATLHVVPNAPARQFVLDDASIADWNRPEFIAI
jgi:hypothetical protein